MSAASAPGRPSSTPEATTPIVFVVDDDISVRESLEMLIRCEGWQPKTFASAKEFLDQPRAGVPSCLVLDISLPICTGLQLQERIADERADEIPPRGRGKKPAGSRGRRSSVPSWDEIMLGNSRQPD